MSSDGSVTHLLGMLQAGNRNAVQPLWDRYFHQLVACARSALRGAPRRAADEEDVALSAFECFCRGVEEGRFPRLSDRDDLWQLLVLLTARKASNLVRLERRKRRGGGKVRNASAVGTDDEPALDTLIGREPDPEFAVQVAEECRRLLELLDDSTLQAIAVWKMEGHTNEDIAAKLGRAVGTVERKLQLIRRIWEAEGLP